MAEKGENRINQAHPSTVAIRKHPLHPVVVDFPIVLLTAALVTDLLFWWTVDAFWAEFSFWLILVGWLTGLAGVITGLIEFFTIDQARAHPSGWYHFVLADLAVFLATFNLISRLYNRQEPVLFTGLSMSAVVAITLLAASYFGGNLVFHHRIGIHTAEKERGG